MILTLLFEPTTTACADHILQTYFPHLAAQVEEDEVEGSTHRYFLDDGSCVLLTPRGITHWTENGLTLLAYFVRPPALRLPHPQTR